MKIYPAIDVMSGEAVRLEQGKKETKKVYGEPVEIARRFERYVDKIHVVDLDGAFSGTPSNLDTVREILTETELSVQLGGGIRTGKDLKSLEKIGVENPIIGTKALDSNFLEQSSRRFSGLTVSLDIHSENLAVEGWERHLEVDYRELFDELKQYVDRFIFTSVGADGKLEGITDLEKFWDDQEVIYAGGVTSRKDLEMLKTRGFDGAIIGKALYEEKLDLAEITGLRGDVNAG
jgi:phosphoribosylformimino-5-aminoimidazole carboxamide ribotide isomerase